MAKDLLFEIGMEEIPARFVRAAAEQLAAKVAKWLDESGLSRGESRMYATPRRIAVLVRDVQEKQDDQETEVKGPARKIAVDEAGNWTKAALGFARSQQVEPGELYYKEIGGVEYVHARKKIVGRRTVEALPAALKEVAVSMNFPKNMRWGAGELRYVRPIRWLVALFGDEVVPLEIEGVRSGRTTRGHRFLGGEADIPQAAAYADVLREQYVIADIEERRRMIVEQIEELAAARGWMIPIQEDLLEEVLFLVEYPTVLSGGFEPEFLGIPEEVLITSMREHQRYFPVKDGQGKLLPHFVTVRNGNRASLDTVARGNEKVLRARLSDARFFYEEDQKLKIETALEKLEKIVYHEELGTLGDKVRRIRANAEQLAQAWGLDAETRRKVDRAAAICKFDLVTQMVYEFPELQGVMGEDYARLAGEDEEVARAVFEHYQPRFAGDSAPSSRVGAVVGMADKLDTIAACFSIGIVPTGSQDPYALRRQAAGIVQIIREHGLALTLTRLFDIALAGLRDTIGLKRPEDEIIRDLTEFFGLRVKNVLSEFARYDVVDAVMGAGADDVLATIRKAKALQDHLQRPEAFKPVVDAVNRVSNLAAKAASAETDPARFTEASERELYDAWTRFRPNYRAALERGDEAQALAELYTLQAPITRFFDQVMVMAEDEAIRTNRLALLAGLSADFRVFADFQKLVWA
jgi:glycyl-tRNA synthetase beta chain